MTIITLLFPKKSLPTHNKINAYLLLLICICLGFSVSSHADQTQKAGDVLQFLLPATAASMTLIHQDKEGIVEFGKSIATTIGVTEALKYSINEKRPNGGNRSFPSGHTSMAFSSAEFIRKRYGLEYGIPAYALATFVGYSRVESRQHYTRDVVAGAAIGIVSSYFFTDSYSDWHIQPEVSGDYLGVNVNGSW